MLYNIGGILHGDMVSLLWFNKKKTRKYDFRNTTETPFSSYNGATIFIESLSVKIERSGGIV